MSQENPSPQAVETPQDPTPPQSPQAAGEFERKFERKLYIRVILSVAIYCVFLIMVITATLTFRVGEYQIALFVLLISAIVLMPRQTIPAGYLERARDQIDKSFAMRMGKLRNWLAIVRFVFFVLAAFSFMLLPMLVEQSASAP